MKIVIGTPFHPNGAFIFNRFLINQKSIQENYPDSELVLATSLPECTDYLEQQLYIHKLKGKAILYQNNKPQFARSRIWDIAAGREAIRNYLLNQSAAQYLLFLDADMLFQNDIIQVMLDEKQNNDVIFSGYPVRDWGIAVSAFGCVLFTRKILEKLNFHCFEFKNGDVITEDEALEYDLFRLRCKVRKGIYLKLEHYKNNTDFLQIQPQKIGSLKILANKPFTRYLLVGLSKMFHRNIPTRMRVFIHNLNEKLRR